jgi:hypothetical protein
MQQEIEKPKKRNSYAIFAWLFMGILIVALAICIFASRFSGSSQRPVSGVFPDDIALTALPSGNRLVNDKTSGYSFILPGSWYFEKKEGSGIALYPDYDPKGSVAPKCKIEISVFKNIAATDMNDWVTSHIHEDPTVAVAETLREALSVSGATFAFEWKGTIDGIATAVAYISAEGNIYEIAPSVLDMRKADSNTVCDAGLQSFLSGISFGNNAKER